jgi:transposase-like protein
VRDALTHGATVAQVAEAMGLDVEEVRIGLRTWADGQLDLFESLGSEGIGITAGEHDAVLALIVG